MARPRLRPDTGRVGDEFTCERCGAQVSLRLGDTGWPTLADAASVTAAHRECLRRPAGAAAS